MNKGVLIIGGSEAGLQAALDLADGGVDVHLVEAAPFIGNNRCTELAAHLLHTRLLETARHPRVTLWADTVLTEISGVSGNYRLRLRQNPRYVDPARCTACGDCLDVCPVTVPGKNRKAIYIDDEGVPGCAAIDKIGIAPCSNACPGGIHVQGYVALVAEGRFQEALDLIREAIPFPAICGRICTHPCEINCRRNEIDTPISIRLLKRFVSDWEASGSGNPPTTDRNQSKTENSMKKVAVVGAGPAGMTAAAYLADRGYPVTVFEKLPVIGGMLAVGIPAYRLPRDVIAREYDVIRQKGVAVRLNTTIGPGGDFSMEDLLAGGYEAVCLTVGAHKSTTLGIPGEKLRGVAHGIDLLKKVSLAQQIDDPKRQETLETLLPRGSRTRAAVLGGGNTAMDVARTMRRLGLSDVQIFYRRSRDEMPALAEEVSETENEGVQINLLTAPKAIKGDAKGRVIGIECMRMELGAPDRSGRRRPVPVPGSEYELDLDLVVLAIGQAPDLDFIGSDTAITIGNDWRIQVDDHSFMTGQRGVFAAGDVITRNRMSAIEAIGMGKQMARQIDRFLRGEHVESHPEESASIPVADRELVPEETIPVPKRDAAMLPINKRLQGFDEVEMGFSEEDAVQEARRCLQCGPCSECQACVHACKAEALKHAQAAKHVDLNADMVICAGNPESAFEHLPETPEDIITIHPDDSIAGSAAAALMKTEWFYETVVRQPPDRLPLSKTDTGVGVYICRCGDDMGGAIRTQELLESVLKHNGVVHSAMLTHACGMDAANRIKQDIAALGLDRMVLAACSCCSSDQVCFSCTYQRVRCKENLGLFQSPAGISGVADQDFVWPEIIELVNIREQCAWVHRNNPDAATDKARVLIEGAVSRIKGGAVESTEPINREPSAMVVGRGLATQSCLETLQKSGVPAVHLREPSSPIDDENGYYTTHGNGRTLKALSIIMTPEDASEADQMVRWLSSNGSGQAIVCRAGEMETNRPGIFFCDPDHPEQESAGRAVAARCRAWMGRIQGCPPGASGKVDPGRCRMCYTCVGICEIGAPRILGRDSDRHVWIDPAVCTGCGSCAANCPSNAIRAGGLTDWQMEVMIADMLSCGRTDRGA